MNPRSLARHFFAPIVLGVCLLLTTGVMADDPDLTGYKAVRIQVKTWDQIAQIHALNALLMSDAEGVGPVDYVMPPESMPALDQMGVGYEILNDDVGAMIAAERARLAGQGQAEPRSPDWFTDYKDITAVNAKLNAMATDRPDLVSVLDLGITLENRHIYGVRISGSSTEKPALLFDGCHHAREWISVMVPMWIADQLVYSYDTDPTIHALVDQLEFFIVPVVNVDGYVYTWTTYRLWRKNRRLNPGGCYGVDDNRNYEAGWGLPGASSDPCNETYRGSAPFSEPETAAMRDFAIARPQIAAYQSYHSYSQLVMSPWGYTGNLPPQNAIFMQVDAAQSAAIYAVHGMSYGYGPIYTTIYPASGTSVDWMYDHEGIWAFTTELRDTGTYGFTLPPAQIIPTCEENFAAAMYLSDWTSKPVKFTFPNGTPSRVDPNTPTTVAVDITVIIGALDTTSPRLYARIGETGAFTEYSLTSQGGNSYSGTLPATPCGRTVRYYFSAATTDGAVGYSPENAPATVYSATAAALATVLDVNMNTNPGWTTQGAWAWGHPTGGGSHNHDPANGYTGTNVYGYNLSGDYTNNMPAYYLTTPTINCTGRYGVSLEFYRWLGVESECNCDKATIEVSNNGGTTWTVVWRESMEGAISDSSWHHVTYDISSVADNHANVRIRWGMGPTDGWVTYPGWNIDDVKVWASVPAPCVGVPFAPGDVNQDGVVDGRDIAAFVQVILDPGSASPAQLCCADVNGDCVADTGDIVPFVNLLLAP